MKVTNGVSQRISEPSSSDIFDLAGEYVDAHFSRGDRMLYVTFDNLGTVGKFEQPRPWMMQIIGEHGFSILGLIAKRKDWYRNGDAEAHLTFLKERGFFDQFDRVVFAGTSMGGYAALTYSRIVPGSEILAFSPQTTLNRKIVPFERRYKYGHRRWDWDTPNFLDAADAVLAASRIRVFYDPFVVEDKLHAQRLKGPNVEFLRCRHFGHTLVRQIKECGALSDLIGAVGRGEFDEVAFFATLRNRRGARKWRRSLVEKLQERGQERSTLVAVDHFLSSDPNARYLVQARKDLDGPPTADNAEPTSKPETIFFPTGEETKFFRGAIERIPDAIIVPERRADRKLASGVLYPDGEFCELSTAWIRLRKKILPPTLGASEERKVLAGRHLYAGHLRGHFGHFLVESTARLWGIPHLGNQIDGIVYYPYGAKTSNSTAVGIAAHYREIFEILGIGGQVNVVSSPTQVETLYVPELGFGWGERYAGSAQYRAFFRNRMSDAVEAEGGKRLYISRSGLAAQRGGILGEEVIEENLARQGYEVFRPEKHSLREQMARYKAAEQIVALDGSALHLAAYLMKPGGRVGVILRRSRANIMDYDLQFRSFCGIAIDPVDAIKNDWVAAQGGRVDFKSIGELDFAHLFKRLSKLGYIEPNFEPELPADEEIRGLLAAYSDRRQEALHPIPKHLG